MNRAYTINLVRHDYLKKIGRLSSSDFFDVFSVKYLKAKHRVCALPFWFWWKVGKGSQNESFEIPKHYIDECLLHAKERFVFIPLCLQSPVPGSTHANALLCDKKKGTVERFEPHGARAYELFKDYHYESLDEQLAAYFKQEYGLEYIAPITYCPALGPQSIEHYITESGYCATWSLWYIDMRLSNPDVARDKLVKGMFDKLHDMLTKGTIVGYLLDYAKQVYAIMLTDFPHYEEFFVNYDEYKRLPMSNPKRKAFEKFLDEMENLVKDPLFINKPVKMRMKRMVTPVKKRKTTTKTGRKKSAGKRKKPQKRKTPRKKASGRKKQSRRRKSKGKKRSQH